MRLKLVFLLTLVTVSGLVLNHCTSQTPNKLSDYLPDETDLSSWIQADTARTFKGEDLFLLINGGAEKYHEFGFRQVVSTEYTGINDKQITLELYEMTDITAADRIYTFKASSDGELLKIGTEARLEDYYLNFKKDRFLVTLIGFDSEEDTREGLVALARAIDSKLSTAHTDSQ